MSTVKRTAEQYDISAYLPFWNNLKPSQKSALRSCQQKTYTDREKIMLGPNDRNGFLLVLDGSIRVYISSPGGREFTLYHAGRGEFCSLLPMDGQGTPTLEAFGGCTFVHINMLVLLPIFSLYPDYVNYFLSHIGRNVQSVLNNIEHAFFNPLKSSIARIILESCPVGIDTMYVTHEQIANHFGTTREVVSREIEGFRNQGLISTGRGRITVLDRRGLLRVAEP